MRYVIGAIIFLSAASVSAQEIRQHMRGIYDAYKLLQPYIFSLEKFEDERNGKVIEPQLKRLAEGFHRIEDLKSPMKAEPGFSATLAITDEMLDDVYTNFKKGNKSYAHWRMRALSAHCATCHVTYNTKLQFDDKFYDPKELSDFERGNFYYSTRQFKKASEHFMKSVRSESQNSMTALRRWLLVETRLEQEPDKAYDKLKRVSSELELPTYEQEKIESWISSLKKWSTPPPFKTLEDAENIIKDAIAHDPLTPDSDEVSLLKATALIHSLLPDLHGKERARALLKLGYCYDRLPLFFIDELPEIYLELAIQSLPGSDEAKSAFRLYSEIVERNYTGSGGTEIPSDVRVKLMELYNKAYNIPGLTVKKKE